jgi:hypothetical protein
MEMTPRQLEAFLFLAGKRRRRELRDLLHMTTLGARGEEKAVRAQLREWEN